MTQGFRLNVRLTPELFRMLQDLRLAMFASTDSDVVRYLITEGYAAEYGAIERAKADKAARDARQLKLPAVNIDPIDRRAGDVFERPICPALAKTDFDKSPCMARVRDGRCIWCERVLPANWNAPILEVATRAPTADVARVHAKQPKARKQRKAKK